MGVRCGVICIIARFVASSDQETVASKQLAAPLPCAHLLTDLSRTWKQKGQEGQREAKKNFCASLPFLPFLLLLFKLFKKSE
jgi:hypothetical protein